MILNNKRFGMNYKFIYIAGPIEWVNEEEREDWRLLADLQFENKTNFVKGINPGRNQDKPYDGTYADAQRIVQNNYNDCKMCDAILAYLPKEINNRRPSYGAAFEIAWFIEMRKPIVIVTDDDYVKYHPMFKAHTGYIYDTLDEGIDQIVDLFNDFVT